MARNTQQFDESNVREFIRRLWKKELKLSADEIERVPLDEDFIACGGDSLALLAVFSRLEEEYDITFSEELMYNNRSINQQVTLVNKLTEAEHA